MPHFLIFENPKLKIDATLNDGQLLVCPQGKFDEDFRCENLLEFFRAQENTARRVTIDLSRVSEINSCGVREWLIMLERLSSKIRPYFRGISEFVVEQANMVPAVLGRDPSRIESFQVPFHCLPCGNRHVRPMIPSDIQWKEEEAPLIPVQKCPKCGGDMNFDSILEEYFYFLRR